MIMQVKIGDVLDVFKGGVHYDGKVTEVTKSGNIRVNFNGKSQLFTKHGYAFYTNETGTINYKPKITQVIHSETDK